MSLAKYSIGTKIFGAFVAMSLIIAMLGLGSYVVLSNAGGMAVTTFDGPLMAINYARAAQTDFVEMQMAELRSETATPVERPGIAAEIGDFYTSFAEDLDIATQRSYDNDEQRIIRQIRPLVAAWRDARRRGDAKGLARLDAQIDDKFDLLVELNTDHSFVSRRQTMSAVSYYEYATITAAILALAIAGAITLFLRRRIVRPLAAAATVADRIARGELQTEIPPGGADETGALLRSMTVMQDNIRDMMMRETQMRRSAENRLADALETSREGVILVAPDGKIVLANSELREFFPAIAGSLVSGTDFAQALALIQTQLCPREEGRVDPSGHAELELADGRWIRMTASATSEGGSIIFLSDFTEIKDREESLRRATREAEAANAAKTRFLANMSHELRTPLNAIIGFSEIINSQLFGEIGNARYLDYSGDILRSGRHLLDVINSVLDLSKSESGKMMLDVRPVDMQDVLQDCVTMVREQLADAELNFEVSGLEQELKLSGDPAKLRQIFLNLLSNAIKFTESGGKVWLSADRTDVGVAVTVGDTGIGMSQEDLHIALQPFGQVDNRLERRYEGTGLGLPLTRAFVELHGANMVFESARGQGTRITVTFPAEQRTSRRQLGRRTAGVNLVDRDMLFGGLDRFHKADRIGNVGGGHGIDAGAFDPHHAIAEDAAQDALIDPHAFDIGQGDLIGVHGKKAVFFHKAVAGDPDLGGPFENHPPQESDQAPQEQQRHQGGVPGDGLGCVEGRRLAFAPAEAGQERYARHQQRQPGGQDIEPGKMRPGDDGFAVPQRLVDIGHG